MSHRLRCLRSSWEGIRSRSPTAPDRGIMKRKLPQDRKWRAARTSLAALFLGLAIGVASLEGQAVQGERFWISPAVGLVPDHPVNFSEHRCGGRGHVLQLDAGLFLTNHIFLSGASAWMRGVENSCAIVGDPWGNPAPPPATGEWRREFYGPDPAVLGMEYRVLHLLAGTEVWRRSNGGSVRVAAGASHISSKDLWGPMVSARGLAAIPGVPVLIGVGVDLRRMSVPYQIERVNTTTASLWKRQSPLVAIRVWSLQSRSGWSTVSDPGKGTYSSA